jgi:WD40 repeat protein
MSFEGDAELQIRDLDTGASFSLDEYSTFSPDSVASPARPSVKPDIPRTVEWSTFVKQKKSSFYRNIAISQVIKPHTGAIRCLASNRDGKYIATGGEDGLIVLYLFTGYLSIARKFSGHTSDVTCIAFSCDDMVISASLDNTVRLWHPSQSKYLGIFKHEEAVIAVASHPTDSSIFLACTFGNSVLVWSITDNEVIQTLAFVSLPTAAAFSPDGKRVAIGCYNGVCFFYALPDFRYVTQFIAGPRKKKKISNKKITSIAFVSDSQFLVSTNDSRIRLYSSENFSVIRKYVGHVTEHAQQRMTLSCDGGLLAIGSEQKGDVFIWPLDHEPHFKGGGLTAFSRDRSKTAEGFSLGKKVEVTVVLMTAQNTLSHASIVVADSDGQLYLVLSA